MCMEELGEKGTERMKDRGRDAPGPLSSIPHHLASTASEIKGSSLESDLSSSPM